MENTSIPQTYKALVAHEKGEKPTIEDIPLPELADDQVLVRLAFVPINPSDLLCIDAFYRLTPSPHLVGREGSGTVVAVGKNLKRPFKVGDRVHVHGAGTHAQYVVSDTANVALIRGDLSLEEAASHIINPATVAYMVSLALRGGHKAAISTAASSALGKMLIRYLKEKGIKSINIVRQDKYIDELKSIGADYVLNSEAEDFEAKLKELAEKEQATIAFDAVNGDFTYKIINNQPPNSKIYVYGFLSGGNMQDIMSKKELDNGKTIQGLIYTTYIDEFTERGEIDKLYDEIHSRLQTVFKSNIRKVFPLDEINEAIAFYQADPSQGKVLIKPN